tara:strand:+ start:705 stop:1232 length:528 start_codon:yes stop_codon:yes gene_type:complete
MRKFILLTVLSLITFSCEMPVKQDAEMERAPGFLRAGGEQLNAYEASPENLDIWDKYIDAHNDRDLELIASMNIDSTELGNFRILSPNGQIILGSDTQIEFLKGWFEAENPKWKTNFSFSMRLEGQKGEWVITGSEVKKTVDGEEVTTYDVADVYIEDGKIGAFWVYSRASVPVE